MPTTTCRTVCSAKGTTGVEKKKMISALREHTAWHTLPGRCPKPAQIVQSSVFACDLNGKHGFAVARSSWVSISSQELSPALPMPARSPKPEVDGLSGHRPHNAPASLSPPSSYCSSCISSFCDVSSSTLMPHPGTKASSSAQGDFSFCIRRLPSPVCSSS